MVINLIVMLLLLVCAIMLVSGRSLNINVVHTHKVEQQEKPETHAEQELATDEDSKELSELLQDILGVLDED